jgi:hypothetical protein
MAVLVVFQRGESKARFFMKNFKKQKSSGSMSRSGRGELTPETKTPRVK